MQLMKVSDFRAKCFVPGSLPDLRTLKADIDAGNLPGQVIGSRYYVDVDRLNQPQKDLVAKVLQ